MNYTDSARLDFATLLGHEFSDKSKALQVQARTSITTGSPSQSSIAFGDCFAGSWCLVAPPAAPDLDASGNVKAACEAVVMEMGDEFTTIGTRDVRYSKWAADIKAGEAALFNKFGSRLAMREKTVSFFAGGGHLTFSIEKKKVSLVGIPEKPGGSAPNMTFTTSGWGIVSASGQSSITVDGGQVTLSGASASIDAGSVSIGTNAVDPVIILSTLQEWVTQLYAYLTTNAAALAAFGATTPPPSLAMVRGSLSVKASK